MQDIEWDRPAVPPPSIDLLRSMLKAVCLKTKGADRRDSTRYEARFVPLRISHS